MADIKKLKRCANCRYCNQWETIATCCRYPPKLAVEDCEYGLFPGLSEYELNKRWCGEWEAIDD